MSWLRHAGVILASVAAICFAGRAAADDAATHDLECLASVNLLAQSTDPKVRAAAPAVYAFYLGRLTQMGLGPAQIEKDIEMRRQPFVRNTRTLTSRISPRPAVKRRTPLWPR